MTDLEYLKKYYKGNIDDAINRLNNGEPLQYIVGNVDFYNITIKVNKDVLIPRFETELLVDETIEYISNMFNKANILDIGTGSGCIAISLKKALELSTVTAVDISLDALNIAKENAVLNDVDINFIKSDIFSNINSKYDVIISNPPYIGTNDILDKIVLDNEPHLALFASNDGLYFYQEILKNAHKYLNDKFIIALEIGSNQGEKVVTIAKEYFKNEEILLKNDLSGKNRYIFIIKR